MTSGNFKTIQIDEIVVNRESRQRRELTGLHELADSIQKVGLINPPVINENNVLVAGERRFTACRDILGWTMIQVQFAEECDDETIHLIELEENVKRIDLPWQDQCAAVAEYHRLRKQDDESWTQAKTSQALGISQSEAFSRIAVASAIEDGDERVMNADKYSVARGIVERKTQRQKENASDTISSMLGGGETAAVADLEEAVAGEEPEPTTSDSPIKNLDFTEWAATYEGPRFNFIHCDFPYGVNAQSHNQGAGSAYGTYDDSADVYFTLIQTLADAMDNVVSESAHLMFWFSMDYYEKTRALLTEMGWKVNPFPLIWHKNDNSGILPDPKRGPRRIYETAFLASRGDRFLVGPVANTFSASNLKTTHMSEKNPTMLAHFFRMFVDETSHVLDPTAGSGNAIVVADQMGAAYSLGLERDPEFCAAAQENYQRLLYPEE